MVNDIEVDWSGQIPLLLAVKESWKDIPIDLYLAEYIVNLRIRPDMTNPEERIHMVMYGQKNIMVVA